MSTDISVDKEPSVPDAASIEQQTQIVLPFDPPSIPNGGLAAWLQVLGAHFLFFNSWGIVNTFGAYQTYYETDLLKHHTSSQISWIGTFQGFLLVVVSMVGGPLFDQGHFRLLLSVGSFLVVFGIMMTSLATQYWQIFLAQGVCTGLGAGSVFLPSVAIVATYFSTRRAVATGIVAAGGSIGSVIYTILFWNLQPKIGFPWATRVIGFIALVSLLISNILMKPRLQPPKKSRIIIDLAAFRSPIFVLYSFGIFLCFIGLYMPFFYIIVYAEHNVGIAEDVSFYLLSLLNAASIFGRIVMGLVADKVGSLEVIIVCTFVSAILSYSWLAIQNFGGLIVFCILYGFSSGAVVSLQPTILAKIVPEMRALGTWMGMGFAFAGLGFLIGNPIVGALINVEANIFKTGNIFAASTIMASGLVFTVAKLTMVQRTERRIV